MKRHKEILSQGDKETKRQGDSRKRQEDMTNLSPCLISLSLWQRDEESRAPKTAKFTIAGPTWKGVHTGDQERRAVPNPQRKKITTRKPWNEHLTGYVGWWRRVEIDERKGRGCTEINKGVVGRGEEAKIKFLSKFYPGICYSPGG